MFTFEIVVTDECQKKYGSLYNSVNYYMGMSLIDRATFLFLPIPK